MVLLKSKNDWQVLELSGHLTTLYEDERHRKKQQKNSNMLPKATYCPN